MSDQYSILRVDVIANAGAVNLLMLTVRVFQADQTIIGKDSAEIQAKSQQIIQKNTFVTLLLTLNFDGEEGGVWCYTTDPHKRWEYCPVPNCRNPADKWWWEQPQLRDP